MTDMETNIIRPLSLKKMQLWIEETSEHFFVIDVQCMFTLLLLLLLARDAFVRTSRRVIVMMFVRLSVCLYGTGIVTIRCTYSAALSLWLDSQIF